MRLSTPRAVFSLAAVAALVAMALWAPTASATFHLMNVREVYPGSVSNPNSEYVELQMWAAGQNHVDGHVLRLYGAGGALNGTATFTSDVAREANQSTMVLATPEAETQFGFLADAAISPSGELDPSGGAVCWESIDCVSWGSFSGSLPSAAGSPAAAIPDGMALRRSIAPGCATLLEPTDDKDNSAVDFAAVFPDPRPNSVAPTEHACASSAGPGPGEGGPGAGTRAPETELRRKPAKRTHDRTPTFRFASDEGGATFQCELDGKAFKACRSPLTTRPLSPGRHSFKVRAIEASGNPDPSPASYSFKVVPKQR